MTVITIWMKSKFQMLCQAVWCSGAGPSMAIEIPAALASASDFTAQPSFHHLESGSSHSTCHRAAVRAA